jgi:phospho-N-acetylmuramoyl-pentapeptide-transferase
MIHLLMQMVVDADLPLQRGLAAFMTAVGLGILVGRPVIRWLRRRKLGERTDKTPIEDRELREQINAKAGTPTMGGLIIAAGLLPACLLWGDLGAAHLWLPLACFFGLFALGLTDDWMKLTGESGGMKVRYKLVVQGLLGAGLGLVMLLSRGPEWSALGEVLRWMPAAVLGGISILWCALVMTTMSNAVNVTDGLDGLAGTLSLITLAPLCVVLLGAGSAVGATAELLVFAGALAGSVLGFLWHNWHPARVFMGDTGSLAIGGSIGLLALLTRTEFLLPFLAFVFLLEFGSSVLQVLWFKATGRRILPIAPAHHIWQQKGLPETHIVFRFCVVALIVVFAASPLL